MVKPEKSVYSPQAVTTLPNSPAIDILLEVKDGADKKYFSESEQVRAPERGQNRGVCKL